MIWHVVLLKPRPNLEAADAGTLIESFKRAVREIPTVRDVRVGQRVVHGAGYEATALDTADYSVVLGFDDLEGLRTYLHHPAHEDLGRRFRESLQSALVYDFEMGGIDRLDSLR